jgi:MFS transporter, PPP family, 3-phenylpropionic acid transporter
MKAIASRLSLAQAASGLTSGVFTPFFGAWLAWRGLSPGWVAGVLTASLLLRALVMPASGVIADARNDRRGAMIVLYIVALAGYGLLIPVKAPWLVFLLAVPATVSYGSGVPLLESVSVRLAERYGFDYGHVRLFASGAFVLANILAGASITLWSMGVFPWWMAVGAAFCLVTSIALPAPAQRHVSGMLRLKLKTTMGETRELLRSPTFAIFLLASSLLQGSHAFYYGYGGLHWRQIGYSGLLIGILWPLGVFVEIALFSQSLRVSRLIGPMRLLLLGALGCVLRWTILAFDPPLPWVVFAQLLHGATFALAHLGAMYFILRAVPPRLAATAQSLYFVCYAGLMMGVATYACGVLYPVYGGRTYLLMSAMGVGAGLFTLVLMRLWQGGRVVEGASEEHIDTI